MQIDATYSPEDNKLRLRASSRLDADTYARVKAAGFAWAPHQELFVAPAWSPAREDLCLELAGDVGDEDTSLVDRAEERAERFDAYAENRTKDANRAHAAVSAICDGIPLGQPILVGHHSERHARRDAEKIDSGMRRAVKMWETAKYWEDRAAGALAHAKYKELPAVRARRIKTIEADRRRVERMRDQSARGEKNWRKVMEETDPAKQYAQALMLANYCHLSRCYTLAEFPRELPRSQYEGAMSLWSALGGSEGEAAGIIGPKWAAEWAVRELAANIARCNRWLSHYDNRLTYERAMLAESGGIVADQIKPEKGGAVRCWCSPGRGNGWSLIVRVNKVSVSVADSWDTAQGTARTFTRIIPLEEIRAVMTKAQVDAAKEAGTLNPTKNGAGFFLSDAPLPEAKQPQQPDPEAEKFEQLRKQAREGVKVVAAPQLFPTPPELARRLVELADVRPGQRVLEPSAGTGNLCRAIHATFTGADCGTLTAIEINAELVRGLEEQRNKTLHAHAANFTIACGDFMDYSPEALGLFDRVVMNPPFADRQDISHILHARQFLKPGGVLAAICANGPRQQAELRPAAAYWEALEPGAFKASGTNVSAALVIFRA